MTEDRKIVVKHCRACGGDGIDPAIKDEDGKVARGERAVRCESCDGTGHIVEVVDQAEAATRREYMVIAVYENGDRFADSYTTTSPQDAEQAARDEYDPEGDRGLLVAGVIALRDDGRMEVVS